MYLFAVSFIAVREDGPVFHTATSVMAPGEDEAMDLALEGLKPQFPEEEGWRDHQVSLELVKDAKVLLVARKAIKRVNAFTAAKTQGTEFQQ